MSSLRANCYLKMLRLSILRIWNKGSPIKMSQISPVYQEIVSIWFKNKEKLLSWLEKGGSNLKRKKLCAGEFENMDKAVYSWFVAKWSQQVPINGTLLKEKALNSVLYSSRGKRGKFYTSLLRNVWGVDHYTFFISNQFISN